MMDKIRINVNGEMKTRQKSQPTMKKVMEDRNGNTLGALKVCLLKIVGEGEVIFTHILKTLF